MHAFARTSRRIVLIFAGCLSLAASDMEAQASGLPPGASLPTSAEILHAAEEAIGSAKAGAAIHSISAIATCHGPKGDYETRVTSDRRGNLSFQQFFPDHKIIEGILDGQGWQVTNDGRYEPIDATEISVLRGHEFPMMALDLRKRFHDFKTVGQAEFEGHPAMQLDMRDDLRRQASAYFSPASHLPLGLKVTNARGGDPITIRFDAWKSIGGVNLVSHVTVRLGSQTWIFDFKTLQLNTADRTTFQIPGTATDSSQPK